MLVLAMDATKDEAAVRAFLDRGGSPNHVLDDDEVRAFIRRELLFTALWYAGLFSLFAPFFVRTTLSWVAFVWIAPAVFFAWKDGVVFNGVGARRLHKMGQNVTLLMAACYWYQGEAAVKILLDRGADVSVLSSKGRSARDLAAWHQCFSSETMARLKK